MKKAAVITLCIALVLSVFAFSAAGETADGFWAKLKQKVQAATPKKEAPTTTAVAGVRGADTDAGDTLYWKGKDKTIEIDAAELDMFNTALDSVMDGNNAEASRLFEEFLAQYPESPLKAEAQEALSRLGAAQSK
jgi:TolA-binding protein